MRGERASARARQAKYIAMASVTLVAVFWIPVVTTWRVPLYLQELLIPSALSGKLAASPRVRTMRVAPELRDELGAYYLGESTCAECITYFV